MTQPDQSLTNSYPYSVHDYTTNSTIPHMSLYNLTNPIVFDGSDHRCIDNEHLQSCDALRTDPMFQLSAELFTRHFRPVIPILYCVLVLILGVFHAVNALYAENKARLNYPDPDKRHSLYLSK